MLDLQVCFLWKAEILMMGDFSSIIYSYATEQQDFRNRPEVQLCSKAGLVSAVELSSLIIYQWNVKTCLLQSAAWVLEHQPNTPTHIHMNTCYLYLALSLWSSLLNLFKMSLNYSFSLLRSCAEFIIHWVCQETLEKYLTIVFQVSEAFHLLVADYWI